jgi:hypothetical protein
VIGSKWVDINATSARIPCVYRQFAGLAFSFDVHEDFFYAVLMELLVIAERD